jgi:Arc/MetJ-type ribon-helix-helix transcriptional regulator
MTITLSPETQRLLEDQLKPGNFVNADEALRAALQSLSELGELDEATLDAIDESEAQIERGEVLEWEEVLARVRAKYGDEAGE